MRNEDGDDNCDNFIVVNCEDGDDFIVIMVMITLLLIVGMVMTLL